MFRVYFLAGRGREVDTFADFRGFAPRRGPLDSSLHEHRNHPRQDLHDQ